MYLKATPSLFRGSFVELAEMDGAIATSLGTEGTSQWIPKPISYQT